MKRFQLLGIVIGMALSVSGISSAKVEVFGHPEVDPGYALEFDYEHSEPYEMKWRIARFLQDKPESRVSFANKDPNNPLWIVVNFHNPYQGMEFPYIKTSDTILCDGGIPLWQEPHQWEGKNEWAICRLVTPYDKVYIVYVCTYKDEKGEDWYAGLMVIPEELQFHRKYKNIPTWGVYGVWVRSRYAKLMTEKQRDTFFNSLGKAPTIKRGERDIHYFNVEEWEHEAKKYQEIIAQQKAEQRKAEQERAQHFKNRQAEAKAKRKAAERKIKK